jgi:phosphoglycolate phosphatase-like HAD superfamily hydrolase
LLDLEPAQWHAYQEVCSELNLPKLDRKSFWMAVRRGAQDGELIRGAKLAQQIEFRRRFDEIVETDECVFLAEPIADVDFALSRLRDLGECVLVSKAPNRTARQKLLDSHDLAIHFTQMKALTTQPGLRVDQLQAIAEGDPRTVVAASDDNLILSTERAGLFSAGIASGASVPARLTRAGARCVFADLGELAGSMSRGGAELVAAGLLPLAATA